MILPVRELTSNLRLIRKVDHEVVVSKITLDFTLVVIFDSRRIQTAKLTDSWRPNDQSKQMLSTVKAFIFHVGEYLPLISLFDHSLEPQMPLYDQLSLFVARL